MSWSVWTARVQEHISAGHGQWAAMRLALQDPPVGGECIAAHRAPAIPDDVGHMLTPSPNQPRTSCLSGKGGGSGGGNRVSGSLCVRHRARAEVARRVGYACDRDDEDDGNPWATLGASTAECPGWDRMHLHEVKAAWTQKMRSAFGERGGRLRVQCAYGLEDVYSCAVIVWADEPTRATLACLPALGHALDHFLVGFPRVALVTREVAAMEAFRKKAFQFHVVVAERLSIGGVNLFPLHCVRFAQFNHVMVLEAKRTLVLRNCDEVCANRPAAVVPWNMRHDFASARTGDFATSKGWNLVREGFYVLRTGYCAYEMMCTRMGPISVHGFHAVFAAMLASWPDVVCLHPKYVTSVAEADDFTFDGRRDLVFVHGYRSAKYPNAANVWNRMRNIGIAQDDGAPYEEVEVP